MLATYNGEAFLSHTLDSLASQTVPVEVLVVDDGSQDHTVNVARRHPLQPIIVTQLNRGVAAARNRGLARASGEWVAFLDQDDLWHRDRTRTLLALAEDTGADAVATTEKAFAYASDRIALERQGDGRAAWPAEWIERGEEERLISTDISEATTRVEDVSLDRLLEGAAMLTTSAMYRRELAISAGGCAPHARALDDHVLNLNVTRIAGPIPRIDSRQLLYRVHPSSTTTISPMAAPFLSTQAAIRLGAAFPNEHHIGSNIEHLLFQLARSDITTADQLGLLLLNSPPNQRWKWFRRWAVRRLHLR